MNNKPKSKNPWNKNQPQHSTKKQAKSSSNNGTAAYPSVSTENKFKEAQKKLQEAVKKYSKDYESSSEEEGELETENLIDSIVKNYTLSGGNEASLGRTRNFLNENLQANAHTCLICISRVKRDDNIWSCIKCSSFFHLLCIQRWSKDSIAQQKHSQDQTRHQMGQISKILWGCPKCRFSYNPEEIPTKYLCFCGKVENPKVDPYLVPHSCGEICRKDLEPKCGHKCLLLCHPGACPPCPVTVEVPCFCGSQPPQPQRCCNKEWSCGQRCGKRLACGKHQCSAPCHAGECSPCPKKSIQRCLCKAQQKLRDCANPIWQCEKVCGKPLDCGHHDCEQVCHENECPPCVLSLPRTCPCGKTKFQLPCTEETPTCPDTCGKLLECLEHTCNQRCHKDKCGLCLETVVKFCRCQQHSKEIQCCKLYLCESKCKNMRDCNKHPCNRKCCDGNCPPCEKPCGRTLNCGNHKCVSVCHRGLCYPCNMTDTVSCRCGQTKIAVPCGRKHKTKPPKCLKPCSLPPDCHHEQRESHRCHFGDCPPCKQICKKSRPNCSHLCQSKCHSAVLVKLETEKPTMPWEQTKPQYEVRELPCPPCEVPVPVTCVGDHETANWPCHMAKSSSCLRPCNRLLSCGNHSCKLPCHFVESAPDNVKAGVNCESCDSVCMKERPEGCQHYCPILCHPGPCPPCKQMVRVKCHCGLNQPYIPCNDWLMLEKREELQSCGNQCPKNFECGHRCRANCHSGPCPNADQCKKKVKLTCKCKRIKKEFQCETVRSNTVEVTCDDVCLMKKEEEKRIREAQEEQNKKQQEIRNQKELEKYQKIFEGKKKHREKKVKQNSKELSFFQKYKILIISSIVMILSFIIFIFWA